MVKRFLFLIFILASLTVFLWSVKYIYDKQNYSSNYYDFLIDDNAQIFYTPNANKLLNKSNYFPYSQNTQLNTLNSNLNLLSNYDFNKKISPSVFISNDIENFNIIFKNNDLTISNILTELNSVFNLNAELINSKTFKIENNTYYYLKTPLYFIIATKPINLNKKEKPFKVIGNFDYLTQISYFKPATYYKLNHENLFSFQYNDSVTLKGNPVNIHSLLSYLPNNFDTLRFYGSSRFDADKNTLLGIENDNGFYEWVSEGIVHLKKEQHELLIGTQNENQFLKYILEEQTIALSKDSILPTPLYKNNFELLFFETTYDWVNFLPNTKGDFMIFTSYNNINILANSSGAIDWFIKEFQLGNTADKLKLEEFLPQKVNKVEIFKTDQHFIYLSNIKINKNLVLNSKIETENKSGNEQNNSITLINEIFFNETVKEIEVFSENDSNYICLIGKNQITCTNQNGDFLWKYESKEIVKANQIIEQNLTYLVVLEKHQINLIHLKTGEIKSNFPYKLKSSANDILAVKYKNNNNYRILFDQNSKIMNIDMNGHKVEGWNEYTYSGTLKSNLSYVYYNQKDYIYFKTDYDTLYILNRRGEDRFNYHFKTELPNESPYLSIDKNDIIYAYGFDNNYIYFINLINGIKDSVQTELNLQPKSIYWNNRKNKLTLILETYDKLYTFNKFGLTNNEIQKPEPNLEYIWHPNQTLKWYIFGNFNNNDIYLLNDFGTLINSTPLKGNKLSLYKDNFVVSFLNSKLYIYKVN